MKRSWLSILAAALALAATPRLTPAGERDDHDGDADARDRAAGAVAWRAAPSRGTVSARVLAFNDFHGQLSPKALGRRPAGGAAVLVSYLKAAQAGLEDRTFVVHDGDHVGASPPSSALLQDEPAISVMNLLANRHCRTLEAEARGFGGDEDGDDAWEGWLDPRCNLVGAVGNHEFDEGTAELQRLLRGGNHPAGPFLESPWRGARYPTLAANVVDAKTGRPVLPPYVVKRVDGIPVAFIGVILEETPTIVTPAGVAGLAFLDEAETVNRYVRKLQRRGVHAFVVLVHLGGAQSPSFAGPTQVGPVGGDLADIQRVVTRLDDDVDVVVSGHRHAFTNALLRTGGGKEVLVTQAFSASTAYAQIDLELDRRTRDVVAKTATVPTTWGDAGPGLTPDPAAAALVAAADAKVAPLVGLVVGTATAPVTRTPSAAGEQPLGDVIADAQRAAVPGAEAAFMNPGGIRADLAAGDVRWGDLFTIQPFGNGLVAMTLTGDQVKTLLEQQWVGQASPRMLQVSGITYRWSRSAPAGSKVSAIAIGGRPVDPAASYRVVVNSFLASGGDNFLVLVQGTGLVGGGLDLDALVAWIEAQPGRTLSPPAAERITVVP